MNLLIALAVFVVPGFIMALATLFNLNWFFATRYTSPMVHILGRDGARVLYGSIGALALIAGAAVAFI